ncbi:hypothetical protein C5167_018083 [Papaver somniferum]|uniref:beta-galactosidase n=1 Tax=Papaver somniferum TaxID=3469 RepID=A0A4Y7IQA5_PAPSO|nr:hypothetical protein C5167_018083 [Papaver somniferum]
MELWGFSCVGSNMSLECISELTMDFKDAMQKFTTKIVDMMKYEKMFQTQGGPIIMSQIDNEYGPEEWQLGAPGKAYTKWAAAMALGLGTGVPWVSRFLTRKRLINQSHSANKGVKRSGKSFPGVEHKPKRIEEAHSGTGFTQSDSPAAPVLCRPLRYILDSRSRPGSWKGLLREPKYGHLRDLHKAIKLCEPALLYSEPIKTVLGKHQEAHVFNYKAGGCAAFLANNVANSHATVTFRGLKYYLPPWSISILPDCKNTVFNTARSWNELWLGQSSVAKMTRESSGFSWQSYNEEIASYEYNDNSATITRELMEQINVTRDNSDYLWYSTDVKIEPNEAFLKNGHDPVLTVMSAGHALHVFINGQLSGTAYGNLDNPKLTFSNNVKLRVGINKITLLSVAVGLPVSFSCVSPLFHGVLFRILLVWSQENLTILTLCLLVELTQNVGKQFETWNTGVLGPVTLKGLNDKQRDLTWQKWSYKIGVTGEALNLGSLRGSFSVKWMQGSLLARNKPLAWYKTIFDAPGGHDPLALDLVSMGKGQVWMNGESIGRHWPAYKAYGKCDVCNYGGYYNETKCASDCGQSSQRWYHVPRSWLKPTGNLMVIFEELSGNPSGVTLDKRTVQSVCADIYEAQPSLESYLALADGKSAVPLNAKAYLWCMPGKKISSIKSASFGTPRGVCGSFREGSCHAHKSYDAFQKNCIGQQSCAVTISPEIFGGDPCPSTRKKLSVEAICT